MGTRISLPETSMLRQEMQETVQKNFGFGIEQQRESTPRRCTRSISVCQFVHHTYLVGLINSCIHTSSEVHHTASLYTHTRTRSSAAAVAAKRLKGLRSLPLMTQAGLDQALEPLLLLLPAAAWIVVLAHHHRRSRLVASLLRVRWCDLHVLFHLQQQKQGIAI